MAKPLLTSKLAVLKSDLIPVYGNTRDGTSVLGPRIQGAFGFVQNQTNQQRSKVTGPGFLVSAKREYKLSDRDVIVGVNTAASNYGSPEDRFPEIKKERHFGVSCSLSVPDFSVEIKTGGSLDFSNS